MKMKNYLLGLLLSVGLVGSLALPECAQAQVYGAQAVTVGSTNNVVALATNTLNKTIDATQYSDIGITIALKMTAAGTSNLVFRFQEGLDGNTNNWSTHNRYVIPVAGNGTTLVNYVTNITTGAIGYLRLATLENTNAAGIFTNVTVTYSIKPKKG